MKKVLLIPALLGVMGIGGFIAVAGEDMVGSAAESKKLSVEQIKNKALQVVNGKITKLEFEKEGTRSFYEVEVTTKDAEYDLKFDAFSGKLFKYDKDPLKDDDREDDDDYYDDKYYKSSDDDYYDDKYYKNGDDDDHYDDKYYKNDDDDDHYDDKYYKNDDDDRYDD